MPKRGLANLAKGAAGGSKVKQERTSRTFVDNAQRTAIDEIVQLLNDRPDSIFPCLQALREDFFSKKPEAHQAEQWPSSYVRLDQVPKYWLLSWLLTLTPLVWTTEQLQAVDRKSKMALRQIVEFLTGIKIYMKLPRVCLDKQVLSKTLTLRMHMMGNRCTSRWWAVLLNKKTSELDWAHAGVLSYIVDEQRFVTEVQHTSGKRAVMPEEVRVKESWELSRNYSDSDVETSHGMLKLKFVQTCPEFEAVRELLTYESFKELAERVMSELEGQKTLAQDGVVAIDPALAKRRKGPPALPPPPAVMAKAIKDKDV